MKKYLLFIALFASVWGFSYAQKLDLGEEYLESPDDILSFPEIVGSDETGYYISHRKIATNFGIGVAFNSRDKKVYLRKFSKDLNLEKSVEVKLNNQEGPEIMEGIFMLGKKLILFSSSTNPKNKTSELFFREVNKSTLAIPETGKSLGTINYASDSKSSSINHNFRISQDSSKLLIYSKFSSEKDMPKRFLVQTYTHELNKLWAREIELPYLDNVFVADFFWSPTFLIENGGRVFVLGKFYPKDSKGRSEESPHFKILMLDAKEETSSEVLVDSGDKLLEGLHLEILNNGDLICVGPFTEKKPSKVSGLYMLKINPTTKAILKENYIEVTAGMVLEGSEASDKKNANAEKDIMHFPSYDFLDITAKADGGVVFVGEQQIRTTGSYGTSFRYNDIIVLDISAECEIKKAFLIPKKQDMKHSNMYLSCGLMMREPSIYLIFNDRVENLNLAAGEEPVMYIPGGLTQNKQVIELVSLNIEGQGDYTRKALNTAKETEIFAIPAVTQQISPHEAIIIFEKRDRRRLGRITF
ncbi:MAG: hypothetical protein R3C61_02670 [Bacteroidia bacterium]